MFMKIANKVKNGEMKEHAKAIESKTHIIRLGGRASQNHVQRIF